MNTAKLKRLIVHDVRINLTGEEIAELFWELDCQAQSEFFNHIATKDRLVFQLRAVTDCDNLTDQGRFAMSRIGEYAPKSTI